MLGIHIDHLIATTGTPDGAQSADTHAEPAKSVSSTTEKDQIDAGTKATELPDAKPSESSPGSTSPTKPDMESWLREASSSLAKMVQEGKVEAAVTNLLVGLAQLQVTQKENSNQQAVNPISNPHTPPMSPRGGNTLNTEIDGCAEDPHGLASRRSSYVPAVPANIYRHASTQTWPLQEVQEEPRNALLARNQTFPGATRATHAAVSPAPAQLLLPQTLPQAFPPSPSQLPPHTKYESDGYDDGYGAVPSNYYPTQTSRPPVFRGQSVPVTRYGNLNRQGHSARVNARGLSLDEAADGLGGFPYANGYINSNNPPMHPSHSGMPSNMTTGQQRMSGNLHQGRGYGPVEWHHENPVQNRLAQNHGQAVYPQYHHAPHSDYDACNCDDYYDDYPEY